MRKLLFTVLVLAALCFTVSPAVYAGPDDGLSKETVEKLAKDLKKLEKEIRRIAEKLKELGGGEAEPLPEPEKQPRPTEPLTQKKVQELQQMLQKATSLIQEQKYDEAIPVHRKLIKEMEKYGIGGQNLAVPAYNLACCLAMKGDKDEAFEMLMKSIMNGYVNFDHMAQDSDLESLHDDPRWKKIFDNKEELAKKAREKLSRQRRPGAQRRPGPQRPPTRPHQPGRQSPEMQKLQEMAEKAIELLQDRKLDEAIEMYNDLIEKSKAAGVGPTGLSVHKYNLACAYALNGHADEAFEALVGSLEDGYVNFPHMKQDPDLKSLHDDPRWDEIFAKKSEYERKAQDKVLEGFMKRFDSEDYLKDFDKEHNIVFITNLGKSLLKSMKSQLNEYADMQWETLFNNRLSRPLAILCLSEADFRKIVPNRGVGGFYQPNNHMLVVPELSYTLVHEFTHALHFADQAAQRQSHPLWIAEGLATLFETSIIEDNKIKCLHNPRLRMVSRAIQSGNLPSWKSFMGTSQRQFMANAGLNYGYTRYIFYWLWEQKLLKNWYDAYCAGWKHDKTGVRAFEYVFNKPIEEIQEDWEKWILECPEPPTHMSVGRSFFGVGTVDGEKGVTVQRVVEDSAADKAGIEVGDVILSFNGEKIESREFFMKSIQAHRVGDKVTVEVLRDDETIEIEIVLCPRPGDLGRRTPTPPEPKPEPKKGGKKWR